MVLITTSQSKATYTLNQKEIERLNGQINVQGLIINAHVELLVLVFHKQN
jgi:hypothetical protein